jgi:hypothetical protein
MGRFHLPQAASVDSTAIKDATIASADLADGAVTRAAVQGLAHTLDTVRDVIEMVSRLSWNASSDASQDIPHVVGAAGHNILIHDAHVLLTTAEGGAMTATLRNAAAGAGNAITSALDLNAAAGTIGRTTTLGNNAITGGTTLYWRCSGAVGTAAGVFVLRYSHTT